MAQTLAAFGTVFVIVAGYFIWIALGIETTVVSAGVPEGFDGVANLQLMHIQGLNLQIGLGAGVVAAILFVGAAIVDAIDDRKAVAVTE